MRTEETFAWTVEAVVEGKRLFDDGQSFSQIAAGLSSFGHLTRNAVIGKFSRLGYSRPKAPRNPQAIGLVPRSHKRKAPSIPRAKVHRFDTVPTDPQPLPSTPMDDLQTPETQRRTLLELENCHCRFPIGEPNEPGFFFCGDPSADMAAGRPYCPQHALRARSNATPSTPDERAMRRRNALKNHGTREAA